MAKRTIGLMLGTETDWPDAFESLVRDALPEFNIRGERVRLETERMAFEPFDLRAKPHYSAVIDRVSYWYPHPREWLKKVAMMDEIYLLNNPFTFQSMEKHTAFCGMIRLGLQIPETWLLPSKSGPDHVKYEPTAARYNRFFDLHEIAERMGYPHFIKPYDGGAWVGVTRVSNDEELDKAYDESDRRLMHLQKSVENFDVFVRSLSIGPQTLVMHYEPDKPLHERYAVHHEFLDESLGKEVVTIARLINSFFRWEFNSCETLVRDRVVYPIDFANAVPDVSIISLHYYFPWAMMALVRWTAFCVVSERVMSIDMNKRKFFEIADRDDLDYHQKLDHYRTLAHDYFQEDAFREFVATDLADFDERALTYFKSDAFDDLVVRTVREAFPEHEHERFIEHYRGLLAHWAECQVTT